MSTGLDNVAAAPVYNSHRSDAAPPARAEAPTALRRLECEILRSQHYTRGIVVQSREYRAPEMLLGCSLLPSCDVWSIGCIAYELVSGRFLFNCLVDRKRSATASSWQQPQRHGAKGRHASDSDSGDALAKDHSYDDDKGTEQRRDKWDGRPIYLEDTEQDLDVFHLKAIMRLLGPPPVSFMRQQPVGLFVDNFLDERGHFRFWERGENAEAGMHLADPYRQQELAPWAASRQALGAGGASVSDAGQQQQSLLLHRVSDVSIPPDTDSLPNSTLSHSSGAGIDKSSLSSMLCMVAPSASSSSAPAAARNGASALVRRDPQDTSNYPIITADWQAVQAILRDKLASVEEAADFEMFLRRCLQWDPARRATAAELLVDDWIVKYSGIVADAIDSDAEE